jgi:hypothetical protein
LIFLESSASGGHLEKTGQGTWETSEKAFPGNGSPKTSKDYEILKLKKQVEELEREKGSLKNFRAFLSQDRA